MCTRSSTLNIHTQVVWCWWAGNIEDSQLTDCFWPLPNQIHSPGKFSVITGMYRLQLHHPFGVGLEVVIIPLEPAQHIIIGVRLIGSKATLHNFELVTCLIPIFSFLSLLFTILLLFGSHSVHVGFITPFTLLGWRRWWHLLISLWRGSFNGHAGFNSPLQYKILFFLSDEAVS